MVALPISILIKVNQIGTLSETLDAIRTGPQKWIQNHDLTSIW